MGTRWELDRLAECRTYDGGGSALVNVVQRVGAVVENATTFFPIAAFLLTIQ